MAELFEHLVFVGELVPDRRQAEFLVVLGGGDDGGLVVAGCAGLVGGHFGGEGRLFVRGRAAQHQPVAARAAQHHAGPGRHAQHRAALGALDHLLALHAELAQALPAADVVHLRIHREVGFAVRAAHFHAPGPTQTRRGR